MVNNMTNNGEWFKKIKQLMLENEQDKDNVNKETTEKLLMKLLDVFGEYQRAYNFDREKWPEHLKEVNDMIWDALEKNRKMK